jgi:hypothetical protein
VLVILTSAALLMMAAGEGHGWKSASKSRFVRASSFKANRDNMSKAFVLT